LRDNAEDMKNRPTVRPLGEPELRRAEAAGVLTLRRAHRLWTPAYVSAQVDAGRWQRPVRRVIVMHNGPLTPLQHRWVAVLSGPPGTVLGGLTAATDDGLEGFEPPEISIVIPNSARMPSPPSGVRVLRSIELTARDVHPICVPPRTRMARSLVDAASDKASPRQRSRAVLLAGCQQGLTTPSALFDALSRRGPCRNRALIKETLADAAGGVESLPELEFDRLSIRAGLPTPTRQRVIRHPSGRYYLDRYWREFDLCVEVHGVPHMAVSQWDADLDRQNEIVIAGPRLLVFSSFAVRHLGAKVVGQLARFARRWAA
jgi:hypothetical protein